MPTYGTPENPYIVQIPGYDDIIKVHPRLTSWKETEIAKQDWAIYFSYKKRGEPEKAIKYLGAAKVAELNRRTARYEALRASPTPEVMKSIGKIMTYIDDTEDLLSTGLVLGRALLKKVPWLATKIAPKFIPALGWVLLARDLMEIGQVLWRIMPFGKKGKKSAWEILNPRSWNKKGRLKRVAKFTAGKFGVGAMIEAAQASDTILGTGLQIGPVMGLVQDRMFGIMAQAGGKTVITQAPPDPAHIREMDRVLRGMKGASKTMVLHKEHFQDTHAVAMTAFGLGIQNMQDIVNDEEIIRRSDKVMGWMVPHELPWEPMTREILTEYGHNPNEAEPHLLPGSPMEVSVAELSQFYADSGMDTLQNYKNMFSDAGSSGFASSTLRETMIGCYNCDQPAGEYLGDDINWETNDEELFLLETLETGKRPPYKESYKRIQERNEYCDPYRDPQRGLLPALNWREGDYEQQLEDAIKNYRRILFSTGTRKMGTGKLDRLLRCHFKYLMPKEDIPTTGPW